jgi:hypothetical protein
MAGLGCHFLFGWNSSFNAQGSRLIVVVVQVGAVKIYVAAVEALRKKERQEMKLSLLPKLMGFFEFHPRLNAHVLFCKFFWIPPWVWYDQTQGSRAVFFLPLRITLLCPFVSSSGSVGVKVLASNFKLCDNFVLGFLHKLEMSFTLLFSMYSFTDFCVAAQNSFGVRKLYFPPWTLPY